MPQFASDEIVDVTPPKRPIPPIEPEESNEGARIAKAFLRAAFMGPLMGLIPGMVVGFVLAAMAGSPGGIANRQALVNSIFLGSIIVCSLVAMAVIFAEEYQKGAHITEDRRRYKRQLANYETALEAYEQAMKTWPEELKRRDAHNAAVRDARAKIEAERQKEAREAAAQEERVKVWKENAERAYRRLMSWRAEFLADCVATYGKRSQDELERLYVEAYPHSPVSGEPHMGCLHHYASNYPEIAKIKNLLPPEIPRP